LTNHPSVLEIVLLFPRYFLRARSQSRFADAPGLDQLILRRALITLSTRLRILWLSILLCLSLVDGVQAQLPLRRFALVVGRNDGGSDREVLRYATRDANAIDSLLKELGGVSSQDALLLLNPDENKLKQAFFDLQKRVVQARASRSQTEVVFYFSGHSDDQGILLGERRVSYSQLRTWLDQIETDLRIAILDSCASGAFTRLKGGVSRAPFLFDRSTQVTGHAFLTSSSADEAAQESDRVEGSYFTHFLLSGLRGAADSNNDKKVTLTEAYRFAFDETLARTYQTEFGAQHPAYEIRLKGTGDLVLTDLRSTSAQIAFDKSFGGRIYIRDERGALLAELNKSESRTALLAVPPGRCTIELTHDSDRFSATVLAQSGKTALVNKSLFHRQTKEETVARGVSRTYLVSPFAAALIPPYGSNPRSRRYPVMNFVDLALLYDDPDAVSGMQLTLGASETKYELSGTQWGLIYNRVAILSGAQISLGINWVREYGAGSQLGWAINLGGSEFVGTQLAFVNLAHHLYGLQIGGFNLTDTRVIGLQVGAFNGATSVDGVQLGAINISKETTGVMIGAVNVSTGRSEVQIGVVNYADEAEVSLGAIGITRKGGTHIEVTTSDVGMALIAVRLDAKSSYTFAGVSYHPLGTSERSYMLGAGLGVKGSLWSDLLWLECDLGYHLVQPLYDFQLSLPNSLIRLRLMIRLELNKHFSVLAGPTLNVLIQTDEDHRVRPGFRFPTERITHEDAKTQVRTWMGFVTGLLF
jgi:hypothetical protein